VLEELLVDMLGLFEVVSAMSPNEGVYHLEVLFKKFFFLHICINILFPYPCFAYVSTS
jgi:hypothetical protein